MPDADVESSRPLLQEAVLHAVDQRRDDGQGRWPSDQVQPPWKDHVAFAPVRVPTRGHTWKIQFDSRLVERFRRDFAAFMCNWVISSIKSLHFDLKGSFIRIEALTFVLSILVVAECR